MGYNDTRDSRAAPLARLAVDLDAISPRGPLRGELVSGRSMKLADAVATRTMAAVIFAGHNGAPGNCRRKFCGTFINRKTRCGITKVSEGNAVRKRAGQFILNFAGCEGVLA